MPLASRHHPGRSDLDSHLFFQLLGGNEERIPDRREGWGIGEVESLEILEAHTRLERGGDHVDAARSARVADYTATEKTAGRAIGNQFDAGRGSAVIARAGARVDAGGHRGEASLPGFGFGKAGGRERASE